MVQQLLELVELVPKAIIGIELALDLADRVQHRRVITAAEPAPDLR